MEIKVPQTINDAPLDRLSAWAKYSEQHTDLEDFSDKIEFRVEIVSIFSGVPKTELDRVDYPTLNKVFLHCIEMLAEFEPCDPSGVIEIDGKRYVYDKEIHNVSVAQVIDIKLIDDLYRNPYDLMATLYVEEGMQYNETDKSGSVKNPLNTRVELFKKHPVGEEFLNVLGFFLRDYIILKTAMSGKTYKKSKKILKRAAKQIKTMNGTNGQIT